MHVVTLPLSFSFLKCIHKVVSLANKSILGFKHFAKYPHFAFWLPVFFPHCLQISWNAVSGNVTPPTPPPPRDLCLRPRFVPLVVGSYLPVKKTWLRACHLLEQNIEITVNMWTTPFNLNLNKDFFVHHHGKLGFTFTFLTGLANIS